MKKIATLLLVSMLGGVLTLGSYKLFLEDKPNSSILPETSLTNSFIPVSNSNRAYGTNADFTEAAEKTVHAVVHVKNVAIYKGPRNIWEYYYKGDNGGRALQGTGSGVIITPDGYIVTNNHVIEGASEIEVTLNNNQTYTAEVIGSDAISDIALIKINADDLDYIPFGNSNNVQLGEWVLAVGNPFNLKSTVTAGIISAKARDLNSNDATPQSFIQTDAAINPGNSGGALVNINGELVGINTAISSPSGSYIGYAFAIPSNNARKIVEDIMEFGNVQQGILGIRGGSTINFSPKIKKDFEVNTSQGVFVSDVTKGSGAENAGIQEGDVIRKLDNIDIKSFSELTGYINSKRPGDNINVVLERRGREKELSVKLSKLNTYSITEIGLEVANAAEDDLDNLNLDYGVIINRTLLENLPSEELVGNIIIQINNQKVDNIREVEKIITKRNPSDPIVITFIDKNGEKQRMAWR